MNPKWAYISRFSGDLTASLPSTKLLRISRKFLRTKVWVRTRQVNQTKGTVTVLAAKPTTETRRNGTHRMCTDGTVFRGNMEGGPKEAEVFLEPESDLRGDARGVRGGLQPQRHRRHRRRTVPGRGAVQHG